MTSYTLSEKTLNLIRTVERASGMAEKEKEQIDSKYVDLLVHITIEMERNYPSPVDPTVAGVMGYLDLVSARKELDALSWIMEEYEEYDDGLPTVVPV